MRKERIRHTLNALDDLEPPDKASLLNRTVAVHNRGIVSIDHDIPLPRPRPLLWRRPALTAVMVVLLLALGGGAVWGTEAYTYHTAADFFASYGLTTEGLDHSDYWAVYRDITQGRFELPATAELLRENLNPVTDGNGQVTDTLSASDWAVLWQSWINRHTTDNPPVPEIPDNPLTDDTSRDVTVTHIPVNGQSESYTVSLNGQCFYPDANLEQAALEELGQVTTDYFPITYSSYVKEGYFCRMIGNDIVWSVEIGDLNYVKYKLYKNCLFVAGQTEGDTPNIRVFKISTAGTVLWEAEIDHGNTQELPQCFVCDENTVTLFSRTDRVNISVTVFDNNTGTVQRETATAVEESFIPTISEAIPYQDGYLLRMADKKNTLLVVNSEGIITDRYTYGDSESNYSICNMTEVNGYMYLSITVTDSDSGSRGIPQVYDWLLQFALPNNGFSIPDDDEFTQELDSRIRDCYQALLLICDADTLTPVSFYLMDDGYPASLSMLTVEDGEFIYATPGHEGEAEALQAGCLQWVVEVPYNVAFSPSTSSYTFSGDSFAYTYSISPDGTVRRSISIGDDYRA